MCGQVNAQREGRRGDENTQGAGTKQVLDQAAVVTCQAWKGHICYLDIKNIFVAETI